MSLRRFLFLLPVLIAVLSLLVGVIEKPLTQKAEAQDAPLTLAQILTGLQTQGKTAETRTLAARNKFIAARVRQRGVIFELNEEREKDLRDAGASDELINAIRSVSKGRSKPKDNEVTELKNPNDGQIEITKNTGGLQLVQYSIFLLTNASNGLYIGTEDELKHSARCKFEGGGTNCKETDLVAYKKLLGPFSTYEEAQTALCRSITETRNFQLGIGLKGRWQNSDNWYGLWDVSVSDCSSRSTGNQTETEGIVRSQTDKTERYSITIEFSGQLLPGTLVFTRQGESLGGNMQTPFGTTPIYDGKVTKDGFNFNAGFNVQGQPVEVWVRGTVTGNRISEKIESPQGLMPFSGTRSP